MDRRRGRSRSPRKRDRSRSASYDRRGPDRRRTEPDHHRPTPAEAAPKFEADEKCCVRLGLKAPRASVTRDQVLDELSAVHMADTVRHIVIEEAPRRPEGHRPEDDYVFVRIYFATPDDADVAITEINTPLRPSRWRTFISQRLPLPGPLSGDVGTDPALEAFVEEPPDTVIVDMQEGYVFFSTDELYRSRGLDEYMQAKRQGKVIRRLLCKHYDPDRRVVCRFGSSCSFLHVKAYAMNRLLKISNPRNPLRMPKNEEDIQLSCWEYERRHDTLVIRDLDATVGQQELEFMFAGCRGFKQCFVKRSPKVEKPYGIIRFDDREAATLALCQTYGAGLNISFWGVVEDLRMLQLHAAKNRGQPGPRGPGFRVDPVPARGPPPKVADVVPPPARAAEPVVEKKAAVESKAAPPAAVPFPPLPEGWGYSVSKRTGKYYFFQKGEGKTDFKHPTTAQEYHSTVV